MGVEGMHTVCGCTGCTHQLCWGVEGVHCTGAGAVHCAGAGAVHCAGAGTMHCAGVGTVHCAGVGTVHCAGPNLRISNDKCLQCKLCKLYIDIHCSQLSTYLLSMYRKTRVTYM